MSVSSHLITPPNSFEGYDHLIFAGSYTALSNKLDQNDWSISYQKALHDQLPKEGNGGHVSLLEAGQTHTWIVLPSLASRMNHSARPDALTTALKKLTPSKGRTLILCCPIQPEDAEALCVAMARAYPNFSAKSESRRPAVDCTFSEVVAPAVYEDLLALYEGVQHAAEWVDLPPAQLNVSAFVDEARAIAVRARAEIDVFDGDVLPQMGLGGLWGVGKAAEEGPALVILHGPKSSPDAPQVVWVGKGIVYDTGGLSLKPKGSMSGMKMDMGGAAAVLGAFEVAAAQGAHTDLCAVLCLAENAIGERALRNDDIITLYSGRSVEINNTDAEGRLVLGDGVAYAVQHLRPELIIDIATLTGAQLVATGRRHAGMISNQDALEALAVQSGRSSGDLVHPLPYAPEFFRSEFKSQVADMKNSVKDRANAQSSCAGHFVESHLGDYKGSWLHLDIAGPAFIEERGTGFGVALLTKILNNWREQEH